jgi:hypothetical protein
LEERRESADRADLQQQPVGNGDPNNCQQAARAAAAISGRSLLAIGGVGITTDREELFDVVEKF